MRKIGGQLIASGRVVWKSIGMSAMLSFNRRKALEAAACLLNLAEEGMEYENLVQLLYLADRKALIAWGHPITTASYVATGKGVELSDRIPVFELQQGDMQLTQLNEEFVWEAALSGLEKEDITETAYLSDAEMMVMEEIFAEYGSLSRPELLSLVRELPEMWKHGPISYRDILKAVGKSEKDIAAVEREIEHLVYADALLEHLADRQDIYVVQQRCSEPLET